MHRIEHAGRVRGKTYNIFFESEAPLFLNAEARLVLELVPALRDGRDIALERLDPQLQRNLGQIIDIMHAWGKRLSPVQVSVDMAEPAVKTGSTRVATFFSGGLDSFYTLLKHRKEITDLIFVRGFDVGLEDHELHAMVIANLRAVAEKFGVNLIEVRTNMRLLWDRSLLWGMGHGAALAALGHMLSAHFSRIYVPASYHAKDVFPFGSHPLLDPLWSSSALEFVHDGIEATRVDKAALVATSEAALAHLRVCYENRDGQYNCCLCRKCTQTMFSFMALGRLQDCRTFPFFPSLGHIGNFDFSSTASRPILADNIKALERGGANGELVRLLKRRYAVAVCTASWRAVREALRYALASWWKGRPKWMTSRPTPDRASPGG